MRKGEKITSHMDWPLFIGYIVLVIMGIATIYSTAFSQDHPHLLDMSQKYGKQIMWVGFSIFLGILVFLIDADIYRKFAVPIYLSTLFLLVVVLFMPKVNGARAWLGIGSMGIQPAEFAKISTALLLSKYISGVNIKNQTIGTTAIASTILLVPMVLILLQPDAGTVVVFTSFLFVMYREGITYDPIVLLFTNTIPGVNFKKTWIGSHFIPILFAIVFLCIITLLVSTSTFTFFFVPGIDVKGIFAVIGTLVLISVICFWLVKYVTSKRDTKRFRFIITLGLIISLIISTGVDAAFKSLPSHQKVRIELFLGLREDKNGDDYNRNRAMAAVGSGGLIGKGYLKGTVATVESNHVPESETDFIFCPFAEEWGFLGSFLLVVTYMFMLFRIIVIAERQKSRFNRVYAYSVAMIFFYHFAVNIGMDIGFAPVIGIPLPFFSYGGSSMMSFSILLFVLLKLDSQRNYVLY